ncbi:ty3-gypsy retrotransposon protein [Cucumis melo var. makuwa]|uniref:Ty3-gypsy retrotransposon protein n=1 Tax=Cucumis melo var. makuwa TaxID=1194695 RepID=A0A5D3DBM5_CUCMM|nr:ty3-gypsy retrotransposon protein [Cucumis melo var. makuwa]TYK21047.1 ty3-gypsy retrotransposon protein [Cucumis melo var. makuwa]
MMDSSKGRVVIREDPLFNNFASTFDPSKKESHLEVVFVMITNVTAEVAMTKMEGKINLLIKVVEERDHEIVALEDQMKACETIESSQASIVKVNDKGKFVLEENQMQQFIYVASLMGKQL